MNDLFLIEPLENVGNSDRPLSYMADKLRNKTLLLPEFQRDYVWDKDKLKGWIETVISRQAIGVIVTYQISADPTGSATFLADGLQRLSATNKFLDDPAKYGFGFGNDQARAYCEKFMITVQHRHYRTHLDAMRAFQKLNSGTGLLPGEFYKGELTLNGNGEKLYREIPQIVDMYETPLLERKWVARAKNRPTHHRSTRGSLALFLQYISGTDKLKLWNTMTNKLSGMAVVEQELANYIHTNNVDLDKEIKAFREYTASHFATIEQLLRDTDNEKKPLSFTFSRYLFHINIWRKNTRRSATLYHKFVYELMKLLSPYPYFPTKVVLPDTVPTDMISIKADDITSLNKLCDYFGLQDFYNGKSRPVRPSRTGYNVSHIQPFALYGDGETFLEPAQINKSRGAQVVQP